MTKLAANSHNYEMAVFKIYSKHYVDNHILLLFSFYLVKWKYEQFLFFAKKKKKKKKKAGFMSQIFPIFVGKVITFPETEIEQYFAILKT